MKASTLAQEIRLLIEKYGDLPVTIATLSCEYSASSITHAKEGVLPNLNGIGDQNPPERFVIEARDNVM